MMRWLEISLAFCVLLAPGPPALAQSYQNASALLDRSDPRARRYIREWAVSHAGYAARTFVENEGDEAAMAILACSQPVAIELVAFYASGGFGRLPRPHDFLRAVSKPGNGSEVAFYVIRHPELTDPDNFDAFIAAPLEYAMELKSLADGAATLRSRRESVFGSLTLMIENASANPNARPLAGIVGIAVLLFIVARRIRQRQLGGQTSV